MRVFALMFERIVFHFLEFPSGGPHDHKMRYCQKVFSLCAVYVVVEFLKLWLISTVW